MSKVKGLPAAGIDISPVTDLDWLPTPDLCCCFFDLPVASLLIGISELFLPLFFFGYHVFAYSCGPEGKEEECSTDQMLFVWIILYFAFASTGLAVIVMYIFKKREKLYGIAIVQLILIIFFLLAAILACALLIVDELYMHAAVSLVASLLLLALLTYFVIIINSWSTLDD